MDVQWNRIDDTWEDGLIVIQFNDQEVTIETDLSLDECKVQVDALVAQVATGRPHCKWGGYATNACYIVAACGCQCFPNNCGREEVVTVPKDALAKLKELANHHRVHEIGDTGHASAHEGLNDFFKAIDRMR